MCHILFFLQIPPSPPSSSITEPYTSQRSNHQIYPRRRSKHPAFFLPSNILATRARHINLFDPALLTYSFLIPSGITPGQQNSVQSWRYCISCTRGWAEESQDGWSETVNLEGRGEGRRAYARDVSQGICSSYYIQHASIARRLWTWIRGSGTQGVYGWFERAGRWGGGSPRQTWMMVLSRLFVTTCFHLLPLLSVIQHNRPETGRSSLLNRMLDLNMVWRAKGN